MKHALEAPSLASRSELDEIVEKVLRRSGAKGKLPTDLDVVADSLRLDILDIEEHETRNFFSTLGPSAAEVLRSGLSKLRGFADLRSNIIAIPEATNITEERKRFAASHEIGHQVIPWHKVRQSYLDDGETLAPTVKMEFEREANCVGASLLFQGAQFPKLIRDYRPTIANIKAIASQHKASFHATIWRFVEQYDERIAVAFYYPDNKRAELNSASFSIWCAVGSKAFDKKYPNVDIPAVIASNHSWVESARVPSLSSTAYFDTVLQIEDNIPSKFYAQSYWNGYNLFVLLREVPRMSVLRQPNRGISG